MADPEFYILHNKNQIVQKYHHIFVYKILKSCNVHFSWEICSKTLFVFFKATIKNTKKNAKMFYFFKNIHIKNSIIYITIWWYFQTMWFFTLKHYTRFVLDERPGFGERKILKSCVWFGHTLWILFIFKKILW